jgi:hypothetical protein
MKGGYKGGGRFGGRGKGGRYGQYLRGSGCCGGNTHSGEKIPQTQEERRT